LHGAQVVSQLQLLLSASLVLPDQQPAKRDGSQGCGYLLAHEQSYFQSSIPKFQDCVTVKSLNECEKQCPTDKKTQGWITTSMTDPAAKRANLEELLLKKIESERLASALH
jgi:hypothetical protein